MQMPKRAVGKLAHRVLGDDAEQHVAELSEHDHEHAADAVSDDQHRRDGSQTQS